MPETTHDHVVMIVEDHDGLREAMSFQLEAEGFVVRCARSGSEALQCFATGCRPCLVLLDVHMPGMDGWELCRRLAADPITATVPVIMLSGDSQVIAAHRRHEVGMLGKPVAADELLAAIATWIRCPD